MQKARVGKKSLQSHSSPLPLVPNPSPSLISPATTCVRFSRHLQAAPPSCHTANQSLSTLATPSPWLVAFPRLPLLHLQNGLLRGHAHRHWLRPSGKALGQLRPRLPCPAFARPSPGGAAQPARRPRESLSHTPPLPRAPAVASRLRLRSEPAGLRGLRLWEGPGVPDGRGRV